ncbi:hypothetical protein IFM89_031308 [Coptis chinensis]|uniref:Uncharacterized protein n=1 Tax=Coptis chinensis TaxID=261450 RepID=A0A835IZC7_9MAGN|nr:hypothetical protein IFM89_031308 [Coptis chinensis]
MTIGKRKHKGSVTVLKIFIMSDKQTAKMHEAAQRQFFHMSDVQEDLHKKIQQAASRKLRASIWPQRNKGIEALDQPQIRCRHKNRNLEENARVNHPKLVGKELIKDGSEFGHLLILANSAELLQSEGQSLREESLGEKEENDNVKIEKDFCVLGRTRLTQIRHQARLENHQRVEETHVSHAHQHKNLISIEDSDNSKNVYAEQLQGVSGHRDTEELGPARHELMDCRVHCD